jgi:hypothetical protein
VTEGSKAAVFRSAQERDYRRAALVAMERLRAVNAETVRQLRYTLFRGDALTQDEAEALFDIERSAEPHSEDWAEFLVDTIVDYLLWQQRPSGVLSEAQAEWLISQVDRTRTLPAFAILVAVLEQAHRTPGWFCAAVRGRAVKRWPALEKTRAA